jgi:hypothetical protein
MEKSRERKVTMNQSEYKAAEQHLAELNAKEEEAAKEGVEVVYYTDEDFQLEVDCDAYIVDLACELLHRKGEQS